jgi:uncharacterized SAM-binding protein YcdF (DUF218 family)
MKQLQSKGTRKRTLFWLGALLPFLVLLPIPLVVRDDVHQADAIVVIGGDHKLERIERAVELYRGGYAPAVVISAGTIVQEGSTLVPEAEVMRRQALALGLPEEAVFLETRSQSTYENARYSKDICQAHDMDSVLLVTSAYHSRRARRIFRETLEPEISVSVQPASQKHPFWLWWFYPDQAYVVLYEYRNWIQYWLSGIVTELASRTGSETI